MKVLLPMRPGLNLGNAIPREWTLPGWFWQPKINDERGMLRTIDGALFNRHGALMDRTKAAAFAGVLGELRGAFRNTPWLDLGLIGYRDADTFRDGRGSVIVFDIPGDAHDARTWVERRGQLLCLPTLNLVAERPQAGLAYRFEDEEKAGLLFEATVGVPGLEGIVGRNGRAPYQSGDSKQMAKIRWLKG